MGDSLTLEIVAKMVDEASGSLNSMGLGFGKLSLAMAAGQIEAEAVGKAIDAVTGFVKDSIKAAEQDQQEMAQLGAVIKSTGGAAGVTALSARDLSEELQRTTPISHDATLAAEDMLLTFTNIHQNVFPNTTKAVADMATAMNGGAIPAADQMRQTAILVGKALNDPATGLTRLQRVGVTFTAQQKEQIKAMEAVGNIAGAQGVVLQELQKEFGGSAEAAGHTFAGSLLMLSNNFDVLKEHVGTALLNAITPFVEKIAAFVSSDTFNHWLKDTATVFRLLYDTIRGGDPTITANEQKFAGFARTLSEIQHVVMDEVVPAIVNFYRGAVSLGEQIFSFLKPSLDQLGKVVHDQLMPAMDKLYREVILPLLPTLKVLAEIVGVILIVALRLAIDTLGVVISLLSSLISVFSDVVGAVIRMQATVTSHFMVLRGNIMAAVSGVYNMLVSPYLSFEQWIMGMVNRVSNAIGGMLHAINPGNIVQGLHNLHIPGFASGVTNFSGGLAVVGEQGPELAYLPSGSSVIPAGQTSNILNNIGGSRTITIGQVNLTTPAAVKEFFNSLDQDSLNVGKGLTPARGM